MEPDVAEAHEYAREATVEKFGEDYVGQEPVDYYNEVLSQYLGGEDAEEGNVRTGVKEKQVGSGPKRASIGGSDEPGGNGSDSEEQEPAVEGGEPSAKGSGGSDE